MSTRTEHLFCQTSPHKFVEHEFFVADNRKGHVLVVSGTYYDMGVMIGRELGQIMQEALTTGYPSIKRKIALWLNKKHDIDREIEVALTAFDALTPPEAKMEMRGIYDGCREAGYPLSDPQILEKLNILIELGEQECTLFAVQPPMSKGHTYQLRDLDYYKNVNMIYIPTVIIRIPQDSNGNLIDAATASFDFSSCIGGGILTGINEHGVVFSQSRGPFFKRFSYQGMPIKYLIQQILSKSTTALDAIKIIDQNKPATSHFVIISDPLQTKDSLQLIFMGPELLKYVNCDSYPELSLIEYPDENQRFYELLEGTVYWTDMVGRKVNGVPADFNMQDMYGLMKKNEQKLSSSTGLDIAKFVGNDITFISALFDTTTREAWVAYADRKTPAHNNEFIHFDLKKYFDYKNRVI